ncbi:MAG: GGDEF domain-containing protein [Clostridium sp.]|nr:GGDEF domain-containing protein [Clostridium sp.]
MKKERMNKLFVISIIITIAISIISLFLILKYEEKYVDDREKPEKLKLCGEYYLDGSDKIYPIPKDSNLNIHKNKKIILTGSFNKDIPKNKLLMMRIENMKVTLYVNNKKVYSFGEASTIPTFAKSFGNVYDYFISDGISTSDKIRIELENLYNFRINTTYKDFLNNMYCGYENGLIIKNIRKELLNSALSIFIVSLGIISLWFSYILYKNNISVKQFTCFALLLCFTGIWFFIDFNIQNYVIPFPIFNNSLDFISFLSAIVFLLIYVSFYFKSSWRKIYRISALICLFFISLTSIFQVRGIMDYYDFIPLLHSIGIFAVIFIIISVIYEMKYYCKSELKRLMSSVIIMSLGIAMDILFIKWELISEFIWFKITFIIFLILQFIHSTGYIKTIIKENAKVKVLKELAYTDGMTGVKNKTSYLEKVSKINETLISKSNVAVIIFDLNNLKIINDTLGHENGDLLIINSSKIICDTFKSSNIYRIGGDEFVAILENSDLHECTKLINKMNLEIVKFNKNSLNNINVSIAYGLAIYNKTMDTCYESVFSRADKEMYINKAKMKNTIDK